MLSNDKFGLLMKYYEATNIDTLIYNDTTDDEFMCMVVKADRLDDFEIMRQIEDRYKYI